MPNPLLKRSANGRRGRHVLAAWRIEGQSKSELLLADFTGRTRSWLMSTPVTGSANSPSTLFYFGSAVLPPQKPWRAQARHGLALPHATRLPSALFAPPTVRGDPASSQGIARARTVQRPEKPAQGASETPTSGHQAQSGGARYIFTSPGLVDGAFRPGPDGRDGRLTGGPLVP